MRPALGLLTWMDRNAKADHAYVWIPEPKGALAGSGNIQETTNLKEMEAV